MSEDKVKCESIRLCRICLAPEETQQFDDFFDRRKDYAEKLFFLSKLIVFEISATAPALICYQCQNNLETAARIKKMSFVAAEYFKNLIRSEEMKLLNEIGLNESIQDDIVTVVKQEFDPSEIAEAVETEDFLKFETPNSFESDNENNWNFDENSTKKRQEEDSDEYVEFQNPFKSSSTSVESHKKSKSIKKYKGKYNKDGSKRSYTKGGTKDGICNICGINLTTRERLINHIKVRHEILSENELIPCPIEGCRKKFKIQLYVDRHVENIHKKDKPPKEKEFWPCSYCGIILGSKTALKTHEYRHTVPAQEKKSHSFFCDLCSFSSDKKIRVQYHIERIHLQLRKFKCRMCPADFVHSSLLQYHELRVHLNLRKFVCRYCDKSFTRSSCRLIHERIHTNERPYSCRFCERTFIHHSDYRRHELRHTGGVPIKQFMEQMNQGLVQFVN